MAESDILDLECGYCWMKYEHMEDPRELPCGHSHCRFCLEEEYETTGVRCNHKQCRKFHALSLDDIGKLKKIVADEDEDIDQVPMCERDGCEEPAIICEDSDVKLCTTHLTIKLFSTLIEDLEQLLPRDNITTELAPAAYRGDSRAHKIGSVSRLLEDDIFQKATHFFVTRQMAFGCGIGPHHFLSTMMERYPTDKEYLVEIIHYRRINSHIAKMCKWNEKDPTKQYVVWTDQIRIKDIDGEYKELVRDETGGRTVATSPKQESELFKTLREGKWCYVTDNRYPTARADRDEVVSRAMTRLKETKFNPVANNCETFATKLFLNGKGVVKQYAGFFGYCREIVAKTLVKHLTRNE